MVAEPLVSVITPSFNQGRFLRAAIESVLGQSYARVEYIIVDGASTDESRDVIREYGDRIAYWVSERDSGQSDALNKGFRRASGEIVGWLNADDVYLPDCVTLASRALSADPSLGAVYGDVAVIDWEGRVIGRPKWDDYDFEALLTHRAMLPQPGSFFRRDILERVGFLRTDLHYAMDYDLWLRLGRLAPVCHLRKPVARFRLSETNKSVIAADRWAAEFVRICERFFSDQDLSPRLLGLRAEAFAGAHLHGAANALVTFDTRAARAHLLEAVRCHPRIAFRRNFMGTLGRIVLGRRAGRIARRFRHGLRRLGA